MSFHLVVRPEVDVDLLEAEARYEGQQAGLGRAFLQAVRTAMAHLADDALLYRSRYSFLLASAASPSMSLRSAASSS
jgi:hypothetical protein